MCVRGGQLRFLPCHNVFNIGIFTRGPECENCQKVPPLNLCMFFFFNCITTLRTTRKQFIKKALSITKCLKKLGIIRYNTVLKTFAVTLAGEVVAEPKEFPEPKIEGSLFEDSDDLKIENKQTQKS